MAENSAEQRLPVVRVYLDSATGKLWFKLPVKGARWHKGLDNMAAVSKAITLPRPFEIEYVLEEELEH